MSSSGIVFKIQRHSLHDGAGIRTLVFLKGCPLRCWWCFNPESQIMDEEIVHNPDKCIGCGECLKVCPVPGALRFEDRRVVYDISLCTKCGACLPVCPVSAFVRYGEKMTPGEVADIVARDKIFYDKSGGGVTLSGGEVTAQPEFAAEILRLCGERGIRTAIETCGYCSWDVLSAILRWTDLVLYDIKAIDPEKHRLYTGVDNALILDNLKKIAAAGKELIVRMPIIPGCNDSDKDIEEAADFLQGIEGIREVHILPYEMFGIPKYSKLGRDYALSGLLPPSEERLNEMKNRFASRGFSVRIGG